MKEFNLINADCLEWLENNKEIIPKIKAIITDLPYGVTQNKIDKVIDLEKMWSLIGDITFITTTQQPFTTDLINSNRKNFKYMWYWDKVIKSGHLNAKRQPMRHVEEIAVFYPKQPEYNPQMTKGKPLHHAKGESKAKRNQNLNYGKTQDGYFNEERKHSDMKYPQQLIVENALLKFQKPKSARNKPLNHPTEKPVELMAYLIETYSSEGDIILDLTMGSGTTGVAAAQTNRKFIGIEMNSEIFNVAKRRIEEAYASNHEKRNNYEQN